jgi:hypothetical protein
LQAFSRLPAARQKISLFAKVPGFHAPSSSVFSIASYHSAMSDNNHNMEVDNTPVSVGQLVGQIQPLVERIALLESQVQTLVRICEDQNARMQDQNTQILDQSAQIRLLRERPLSTHRERSMEPKIADPEPFTGIRAELIPFLAKCRLKFLGQPSRYPTEDSKIFFAGSFLRKAPFSWFQPLLSAAENPELPTPEEFESFESFAQALTNIYGDPLLELSSERALNNLTQTGSVSTYTSEFQRLKQYVKWNESAFVGRYYNGLNDETKDEIMRLGRPNSLKEIQDMAFRFDARMFERRQERKHASSPAKSTVTSGNSTPSMSRGPSYSTVASPRLPVPPTPSRTPSPLAVPPAPTTALKTPAFTKDGTVPMEIGYASTAEPKTLTPEEKLYCKQNNLCDYCGQPGHNVFNCARLAFNKANGLTAQKYSSAVTAEFQVPSKDNAEE